MNKTFQKIAAAFILSLFFVLPAYAQSQSAKKAHDYVAAGGFRNFEIKKTDDRIKDVLDTLYTSQGNIWSSAVTLYTDEHTFTGTVIQVTDSFVVLLNQTRVAPRESRVDDIHVIARSKVIGVSAKAVR